jgi:hypothetical protein
MMDQTRSKNLQNFAVVTVAIVERAVPSLHTAAARCRMISFDK